MARSLLAVAVFLASTAAAAAQAQPGDALLRHARELREEGEHEAALALMEQAAERGATPRLWGEMGLSEVAVGRFADAERHLQRALAGGEDEWVAAHRAELAEALAEAAGHVGTLQITGGEAGAEIGLGERTLGTLPLGAQRLDEGSHEIEVRAPGGEAATHEVTIEAGETTRLELESGRAAAGEPEPEVPPTSGGRDAGEPPAREGTSSPSPDADAGDEGSATTTRAPSAFPDSFRERFAPGDRPFASAREREPWPDVWHLALYGGIGWLYNATADFAVSKSLRRGSRNGLTISGALGVRRAFGMSAEVQMRLEARAYDHGRTRSRHLIRNDPPLRSVEREIEGWVLGLVPELGLRLRLAPNGATSAYFGFGVRLGMALYLQKRDNDWYTRGGELVETSDRAADVGFAPEGMMELGALVGPRADWDLGLRLTAGMPTFSVQTVLGIPLGRL